MESSGPRDQFQDGSISTETNGMVISHLDLKILKTNLYWRTPDMNACPHLGDMVGPGFFGSFSWLPF